MDIEDVKKNSKLLIEGIPYNVVEAEFVKPGKGRAIYRLRLKNLMDGSTLDRTFHSSEKVDTANVTVEEKQFLYQEGDHFVFMNTDNFEQSFINEDMVGDKKYFMKEGNLVSVMVLDDRPIDITPPTFVELQVTKTQPSTRADTVTAQNKEAVLETGFTIGVPPFVKEGDIIKVDTRTGTYVERITAKK